MIRTILVVALMGSWFGTEATGEVLRVEGEILSVSLPWSDRLFDEREGPLLEFPSRLTPVPYTALLALNRDNSLASFQVSIDSCIAGAELCVAAIEHEMGIVDDNSAPTTYRLSANLFAGVVQNNASEVEIDFTSLPRPDEWVTTFSLMLDKTTGTGEWHWSYGPAIVCVDENCAPSVPGNRAEATISGFRVVPESVSWLVMFWCGMAVFSARRKTEVGTRVRRVGIAVNQIASVGLARLAEWDG